MSESSSQSEEIEKLYEMIFNIHRAMLVTHTRKGSLRSRPMGVHLCRTDDCLWLFTDKKTAKVMEIRKDSEVNVSFSCNETMSFVSVSGDAALVDDREKIEQIWCPAAAKSYPAGKGDPNLTLIQVTPTFGEYWDAENDTFSLLYEATRALLSGTPKEIPGEHAKINLDKHST